MTEKSIEADASIAKQLVLEAQLEGVRLKLQNLLKDQQILQQEEKRLQKELERLEMQRQSAFPGGGKRKVLSPESRQKIVEAQKRRWAKIKGLLNRAEDQMDSSSDLTKAVVGLRMQPVP